MTGNHEKIAEKLGSHEARLDSHDKIFERIEKQLAWIIRGLVIIWLTFISMGYVTADSSSSLIAWIHNFKH